MSGAPRLHRSDPDDDEPAHVRVLLAPAHPVAQGVRLGRGAAPARRKPSIRLTSGGRARGSVAPNRSSPVRSKPATRVVKFVCEKTTSFAACCANG